MNGLTKYTTITVYHLLLFLGLLLLPIALVLSKLGVTIPYDRVMKPVRRKHECAVDGDQGASDADDGGKEAVDEETTDAADEDEDAADAAGETN